ncbi:hypothetical protein, unlikely [Trypanosoma brucei gambiense DAL972]|uniref:T. brucei spp.-specific protein n=1 Tax=Trypanosoma brucei gambiense (strain MHOM/CI/86/DAL972) TaxID=679716 RepID=C9ZY26_TRYB9|nr:hypothetical protein, unlikely [Trypanosoma brucei gambiense DAL972]CBH14324.1 hypothetical protein, unlikely [Trypanosoma brucei gambiense DAL972]|eukprot:XP_011776591.1 hypothetical protein, unlikely [Trypanosoma brucei gambiense DAL972]
MLIFLMCVFTLHPCGSPLTGANPLLHHFKTRKHASHTSSHTLQKFSLYNVLFRKVFMVHMASVVIKFHDRLPLYTDREVRHSNSSFFTSYPPQIVTLRVIKVASCSICGNLLQNNNNQFPYCVHGLRYKYTIICSLMNVFSVL